MPIEAVPVVAAIAFLLIFGFCCLLAKASMWPRSHRGALYFVLTFLLLFSAAAVQALSL
jgi:hypothetical protein